MDVEALKAAYDRFLDDARGMRDAEPPDGGWRPELVLAHVIVSDRLFAQAAAAVMFGADTRFDNRASQCEPYLEAVVAAAGSWDGLLDQVRKAGEELMALVARIEPDQAMKQIPVYVVADGNVVIDSPLPIGQLVMVSAGVHLPGHAEQLKACAPTPAR